MWDLILSSSWLQICNEAPSLHKDLEDFDAGGEGGNFDVSQVRTTAKIYNLRLCYKINDFPSFSFEEQNLQLLQFTAQLQIFGQSLQISFVQKRTVIAASVARVGFLFLRPKSTLKLTTFNIQESILGDLVKLQFCD